MLASSPPNMAPTEFGSKLVSANKHLAGCSRVMWGTRDEA